MDKTKAYGKRRSGEWGRVPQISTGPAGATPQIAAPPTFTTVAPAPARPLQLPSTPAHNLLGKPLSDQWQPYAPGEEQLMTIKLDISGSELDPPSERSYTDMLLWNVRDTSITPEAYAKLVCEEEVLQSPPFPLATCRLRALPSLLLTPHVALSSQERPSPQTDSASPSPQRTYRLRSPRRLPRSSAARSQAPAQLCRPPTQLIR